MGDSFLLGPTWIIGVTEPHRKDNTTMRQLRTVGGLLLLAFLLIVIVAGLNGNGDAVPAKNAGQEFVTALWNGTVNAIDRLGGDGVGGLAGNGLAAFGVAALTVVGVMLVLPFARAGRGFAITIGLGVAFGLALYSPDLLNTVTA